MGRCCHQCAASQRLLACQRNPPPTADSLPPRCAAPCNLPGSSQRLRICKEHLKSPTVLVNAVPKRFCQQCSRFQDLPDFDSDKRCVCGWGAVGVRLLGADVCSAWRDGRVVCSGVWQAATNGLLPAAAASCTDHSPHLLPSPPSYPAATAARACSSTTAGGARQPPSPRSAIRKASGPMLRAAARSSSSSSCGPLRRMRRWAAASRCCVPYRSQASACRCRPIAAAAKCQTWRQGLLLCMRRRSSPTCRRYH